MELSVYFDPVGLQKMEIFSSRRPRMMDYCIIHSDEQGFPDLEGVQIALIGVPEERGNVNNTGCAGAPDKIREQLFQLFPAHWKIRLADLGNIKKGHSLNDTFFAISAVCGELLKNNITPVLLGGSQDITWATYKSYEELGQIINIVSVDSRFDLGEEDSAISAQSYLSKILLHQPNYLFNYTNIGYQSYYVDNDAVNLMSKLLFDTYRLGVVRADMEEVEPIVRNADMLSVDISAIRKAEAPGNKNAGPNGFYGEEICQIMRYAGLSDKLSCLGIFEYNPEYDDNHQTAMLIAQMIWYFLEGFSHRKNDFPYRDKDKSDYLKYVVPVENHTEDLIFYKSKKSDRWWMEVQCTANVKARYERHYMVPCSYQDYQAACANDIPERWWMVYQKLM
ncbi:MAG: arginase [Bacteroidia bacterium]|nr:arginase [Bacteroidia bacterium]